MRLMTGVFAAAVMLAVPVVAAADDRPAGT